MELERLLRSQGFGSRAECRALVGNGRVSVADEICEDASAQVEPEEGLCLGVDGVVWKYCKFAYLALNKPAGYECSRRPLYYPGVYSLLPLPLVRRGVQAVGRLDHDTTGLLLLTDDGAFIHHCTSPRKQVPKVYEVVTRHAIEDTQIAALLNGVELHDEMQLVAATACLRLGERQIRLTVTQGRYHLVKRMVAAAGNRVEALHRIAIGGFALPTSLAAGQWMWLERPQIELLARRG